MFIRTKKNKYDAFFRAFIQFLLRYDLLKSKRFKDVPLGEISAFEEKHEVKFDQATTSYLRILNRSFWKNVGLRTFESFSLDSMEEALVQGQCSLNNSFCIGLTRSNQLS